MARANFLLLALLIACAIGAISAQHQARKAFNELELEQAQSQRFAEEFTQLQLEQGTWGTHKRVEAIASKSLAMRLPDATTTVVVTLEACSVDGQKPASVDGKKP